MFQHCEQLVQALQTKLLESQQKLAVALQVDTDKDAAIAKLQGAWNSLADHWRSVEDQRHALTKQLQDHKLRSESQLNHMQEVSFPNVFFYVSMLVFNFLCKK